MTDKQAALEAIIQTARNIRGRLVDDDMEPLPAPLLDVFIGVTTESIPEIVEWLPDTDHESGGTWHSSVFNGLLAATYAAFRMKAVNPSLANQMFATEILNLMIRSMEPLREEMAETLAGDSGK